MVFIRIKTNWLAYGYVFFVSIASVALFPVIQEPLDNDVFYHMAVAREMVEQNNFIAKERWFESPGGLLQFKYPPLFHWLLVLFSLGGAIDFEIIAVAFQIVFYPFALISSYLLVSHIKDKGTGFIAIILLTLYFPFFGRTHMAIPEALQHSLIPLTFLFYLKHKEKVAGVMMSIMLANHLFDAVFVLLTILGHWFFYRRGTFGILFFLLLSLPGMVFQVYGICGILNLNSVRNASNSYDFAISVSSNYYRMFLALTSSSIMLILSIWAFRKNILYEDSLLLVIWFLFLVLIFLKLPNRFPAYAALPLGFFVAMLIKNILDKRSPSYEYHLSIIAGLLIANIFLSYQWFPHVYDFYKPGVDKNEKEALLWIKDNLPREEVIQVNPGRSFYEGYRIVYFARHNTTESKNKAKYLYTVFSNEPSDKWCILKTYGLYKIYIRSSKGTTGWDDNLAYPIW